MGDEDAEPAIGVLLVMPAYSQAQRVKSIQATAPRRLRAEFNIQILSNCKHVLM
jgi:hypothetical protein